MNNNILSICQARFYLITSFLLLLSACGGGAQNITIKIQDPAGEEANGNQVVVSTPRNVKKTSEPVKYRVLNDTGIVWGADYPEGNNENCAGDTIEAQDCSHGRDVTHNDNSDGHAGFSYTKISSTGDELPASATEWTCVKDNVTGLMWEVKLTDSSLRSLGHYYSWYSSTGINDGGDPGVSNGGECYDEVNCDTEKYTVAVNEATLCGASDWRLPSRMEMLSLVNNNKTEMMIDYDYFPEPNNHYYYWTSTPYARDGERAFFLDFVYGYTMEYHKQHIFSVRLVRNG